MRVHYYSCHQTFAIFALKTSRFLTIFRLEIRLWFCIKSITYL